MMRYRQLKAHDAFTVRAGQKLRISCCDCGLAHDFLMVASPKGRLITVAVERNERATVQRRRALRRKGEWPL
jgi:hypothetical protein